MTDIFMPSPKLHEACHFAKNTHTGTETIFSFRVSARRDDYR